MAEQHMRILVIDEDGHRKLTVPDGFYLGLEGENALNQVRIRFDAALENSALYNGFDYFLDILYKDNVAGALRLTLSNGWLTSTLTTAYLKSGLAICQVRAVGKNDSSVIWKTTCAEILILSSVSSLVSLFGYGAYHIVSVDNGDGTQTLEITDASQISASRSTSIPLNKPIKEIKYNGTTISLAIPNPQVEAITSVIQNVALAVFDGAEAIIETE